MAVEHVSLWCVRLIADSRVPKRFAGSRVEGDEVRTVAGKDEFSSRRQESGGLAVLELMVPRNIAGAVVDGCQETARAADASVFNAAQSHRSARIDVDEIGNRIAVVLRHVEQFR